MHVFDFRSRPLTSTIVISFFAVFLFFGAAKSSYAAFGISPPYINPDHLVPGITYTQTIYLVQDQPDVDLPVKATVTLPDSVASWVTLDKGFNFVIPAGTHQFPVVVTVHVPDGQGLGKYSGDISFASQPTKTGQVTIALGVDVLVNLTVGDGIFEQFSVPQILFPDIEEGWNPTAYIKFQNDGNIPEGFDSATFDIYDQYDAVRLAYITKNSGFPETPPFTTQEYTIEFPTDFHLGIGQYWGLLTLYKNQKVIATQKTIFNVLKAGSISGFWNSFFRNLGKYLWMIIVGSIVIIALIVFGVLRLRRRRHAGSAR